MPALTSQVDVNVDTNDFDNAVSVTTRVAHDRRGSIAVPSYNVREYRADSGYESVGARLAVPPSADDVQVHTFPATDARSFSFVSLRLDGKQGGVECSTAVHISTEQAIALRDALVAADLQDDDDEVGECPHDNVIGEGRDDEGTYLGQCQDCREPVGRDPYEGGWFLSIHTAADVVDPYECAHDRVTPAGFHGDEMLYLGRCRDCGASMERITQGRGWEMREDAQQPLFQVVGAIVVDTEA